MGSIERVVLLVAAVFVSMASLAVLVFGITAFNRDHARDDRERARDDREDQRDKREKARDQREADRDDERKGKRAVLQWEVRGSLSESYVTFTNFDANEHRFMCGVATVTNKRTSVSAKSTEVCSGQLAPHTTANVLLSFPVASLEHTCTDPEKGFSFEVCAIDFVKTEH